MHGRAAFTGSAWNGTGRPWRPRQIQREREDRESKAYRARRNREHARCNSRGRTMRREAGTVGRAPPCQPGANGVRRRVLHREGAGSYSEGVRCSRRRVALQRRARSSPMGSPLAAGLQKLARAERGWGRESKEATQCGGQGAEVGCERGHLLAILIPPTRPSKILAAQSMVQAQPETTEWSDGLRSEQR